METPDRATHWPSVSGFAVLLGLLALAACSDDKTTDPAPDPTPIEDASGSWLSRDLTDNGVPASRYDIVQSGSVLSGEAFWRWQGGLERIGPISGTIDADGNAEWVTTLNDNGWDGIETVTARFRGGARELVRARRGGDTVSGTYEWRAPDGSTRESGSFTLERPPIVIPAPGTGVLGDAGYWRGALFYSSASGCHTTGYLLVMSLSSSGQTVVGTASATPHPRGAALPDTLPDWFGHLSVDISGILLTGSEPTLSLTLSGDVEALLDGNLAPGPVGTQYIGTFQEAQPCTDSSGPVTTGTFIFNSEQAVP